jgi:hypothetical protein
MNIERKKPDFSGFELCTRCKKNFDSSKSLPCGYKICKTCDTEIKSMKDDHFKCCLCGETHFKETVDFGHQTLKRFKNDHFNENIEEINKLVLNLKEIGDTMESKIRNHYEYLIKLI